MSFCFSSGMPIPVSVTVKCRRTPSAVSSSSSTRTTTSPRSVNLIALPTRLTSTWRSRSGSPTSVPTQLRRDLAAELEAAVVGAHRERPQRVDQGVAQVEVDGVQLELARLDLGEVEDVVDHRQQRVGRLLDHLQVLALLGVELGLQRQLGHADHAVHRRADLVAHVGEELALGAVGLLGLHLRLARPLLAAQQRLVRLAEIPARQKLASQQAFPHGRGQDRDAAGGDDGRQVVEERLTHDPALHGAGGEDGENDRRTSRPTTRHARAAATPPSGAP